MAVTQQFEGWTCYVMRLVWDMLHSKNQKSFRKYIIFSSLKKCFCGWMKWHRMPDERVSRAGVGPRAVIWRPWCNIIMKYFHIFKVTCYCFANFQK